MAAQPLVKTVIEIDLNSAEAAVQDLPAQVEEAERVSIGTRLNWDMDWGDAVLRLLAVGRAAREGQLSTEQQARYRQVLGDLQSLLPLARQLDFDLPEALLEELAALRQAA